MIGILLLGLMAAMPLIQVDFAHKAALVQQTRGLVDDLRWLQQYSMNISKGHASFPQFIGDGTPRMYFIMGKSGQYSIVNGTKILRSHQFSEDVQLGGNYSSLYFRQDGYINVPVTLELRQGNQRSRVIVDRVGRIRIE